MVAQPYRSADHRAGPPGDPPGERPRRPSSVPTAPASASGSLCGKVTPVTPGSTISASPPVRGHGQRRAGRRRLQRHHAERLVEAAAPPWRRWRPAPPAAAVASRKPAKRTVSSSSQPPRLVLQLVPVRPVAGDHHPQPGVPVAQLRHGVRPGAARPSRRPAGRRTRPAGRRRRTGPGRRRPPRGRACQARSSTPLGTTSTRSVAAASSSRVTSHRMYPEQTITRADALLEPVLDGVDAAVHLLGQPALVPARLGGVDGGDQRQVEVLGEGDGGVRDQPVVGVDDVVRAGLGGPQRGPGQRVVERHRPGQQRAGGQREQRRVLGRRARCARRRRTPPAARPAACRVTTVTSWPAAASAVGEGVHVPAEPADDARAGTPRRASAPAGAGRAWMSITSALGVTCGAPLSCPRATRATGTGPGACRVVRVGTNPAGAG